MSEQAVAGWRYGEARRDVLVALERTADLMGGWDLYGLRIDGELVKLGQVFDEVRTGTQKGKLFVIQQMREFSHVKIDAN